MYSHLLETRLDMLLSLFFRFVGTALKKIPIPSEAGGEEES